MTFLFLSTLKGDPLSTVNSIFVNSSWYGSNIVLDYYHVLSFTVCRETKRIQSHIKLQISQELFILSFFSKLVCVFIYLFVPSFVKGRVSY